MKLLLPFLVSFNILMGHALQECPTSSGWSPAETICYRIVHFPESFWAAKAWCKAVEGELLSLENVAQVEKQVGKSMQGNAGDYRIDGWADGQWFHKDNQSLVSEEHELLAALDEKTLTVNLQDWQVDGETEMRTRLGFICEGKPEDLSGTCAQEPGPSYVGCYDCFDMNIGNMGSKDPAECMRLCKAEETESNPLSYFAVKYDGSCTCGQGLTTSKRWESVCDHSCDNGGPAGNFTCGSNRLDSSDTVCSVYQSGVE